MLYRILTENKNIDKIETIVSKFFDGFTIFKAIGYWKNEQEKSLIIEIIGTKIDRSINSIAKQIKKVNSQEAVLVQKIESKEEFI